jgi:hypothetical protein
MLTELIFIVLLALIPASFSFLLDYCLGFPNGDALNTRAIFFKYTLGLALRRVKKIGKFEEVKDSFSLMTGSDDPQSRQQGKEQLALTIVLMGREFFTWERMVGMCPVCTNFYISTIAAGPFFFFIPLTYFSPGLYFIFIPVFSHLILRKI